MKEEEKQNQTEECSHNCSSCGQNCDHRIVKAKQNDRSKIHKVIGVISGKGGVGKSLVSSLLAAQLNRKGNRVAILDGDITGPSIPKSFGVKGPAYGDGTLIYPLKTESGISIMSSSFLLEKEDDPIIWRGPMIGDLVKQFYTDVCWEEVDYMVVDMPPGTGDVALTTFQSLPVDGIVIVTTPQDLVSVIVKKAVHMAEKMGIPILGLIENYAYLECPNCQEKIKIYGESKLQQVAEELHLPILGRLPMRVGVSQLVDEGRVEDVLANELEDAVNAILAL